MADIQKYSEQTFESIKHINEYGQEFWYARELQTALEYTEWRNFKKIIDKAKDACATSGNPVGEHFVEVNKMHTIQTRFRDAAQTSCSRHKRLEHPTLNAFFAKSQHKISVNRAISVY